PARALAVTALAFKENLFSTIPVTSTARSVINGQIVSVDGTAASNLVVYACWTTGNVPCSGTTTDSTGRFRISFATPPGGRYLSINPSTSTGCQAYGYASQIYGL